MKKELTTSNNNIFIRTSVMCFPCIIMTTEFPTIIEFNHLLSCLRFNTFTNTIEFFTKYRNSCFKDSNFMRCPILYSIKSILQHIPIGFVGAISAHKRPNTFARSNKYYSLFKFKILKY